MELDRLGSNVRTGMGGSKQQGASHNDEEADLSTAAAVVFDRTGSPELDLRASTSLGFGRSGVPKRLSDSTVHHFRTTHFFVMADRSRPYRTLDRCAFVYEQFLR